MTTTPTPASQPSPLIEGKARHRLFSLLPTYASGGMSHQAAVDEIVSLFAQPEQPSPARSDMPQECEDCGRSMTRCACCPARSDKDAERAAMHIEALDAAYRAADAVLPFRDKEKRDAVIVRNEILNTIWALRSAFPFAAKAQESAPSGETIATWQERIGAPANANAESYTDVAEDMQAEIADLRAALARRATAAPSSDALEAGVTRMIVGVDGLDSLTTYGSPHGTLISLADAKCVVASAARRATAGTTATPAHETIVSEGSNLVCTACGTTAGNAALEGRIVSVDVSTSEEDAGNRIFANLTGETGSDGTTLLAYEVSRNFAGNAAPVDRNSVLEEAAAICQDQYEFFNKHGRPELGTAVDDVLRRIRHLKTARRAATAAPGDLPPLPMPLDDVEVWLPDDLRGDKKETRECEASDNYWSADQMREYGRACISSNAGAAPAIPEGKPLDISRITSVVRRHRAAVGTSQEEVIVKFGRSKTAANTFLDQFGALVLGDRHAAPSNPPVGAKEQGQ